MNHQFGRELHIQEHIDHSEVVEAVRRWNEEHSGQERSKVSAYDGGEHSQVRISGMTPADLSDTLYKFTLGMPERWQHIRSVGVLRPTWA